MNCIAFVKKIEVPLLLTPKSPTMAVIPVLPKHMFVFSGFVSNSLEFFVSSKNVRWRDGFASCPAYLLIMIQSCAGVCNRVLCDATLALCPNIVYISRVSVCLLPPAHL